MKVKQCFKSYAQNNCVSAALLVLRVLSGLAFVLHGYPKVQAAASWMGEGAPIPGFFQACAALSEFAGGILWMVGLLTPVASFFLGCTMLVAIYFHAIVKGDPFVGHGGSYELAAIYLCIAILLGAAGPGKFSADKYIFGNKEI